MQNTNFGNKSILNNNWWVYKCINYKNMKLFYEWKGLSNKDEHHRIAEGKYLKLLYQLHEERGSLDISSVRTLCGGCDMGSLCEKEGSVEKLTVYCFFIRCSRIIWNNLFNSSVFRCLSNSALRNWLGNRVGDDIGNWHGNHYINIVDIAYYIHWCKNCQTCSCRKKAGSKSYIRVQIYKKRLKNDI